MTLGHKQIFGGYYGWRREVEQAATEMGELQPGNVRMFRTLVSFQSEMFGNGGQTQPIIGLLPAVPPPPAHRQDL